MQAWPGLEVPPTVWICGTPGCAARSTQPLPAGVSVPPRLESGWSTPGGPATPTVQAASNPESAKAALFIRPRAVVIVTGWLMQAATHLVTLGMHLHNV